MKTFDEEKEELVKWLEKAFAKADMEIAKLPDIEEGDDRIAPIRNAVWKEWNSKLIILKIKHNMELSVKEKELKERYGI